MNQLFSIPTALCLPAPDIEALIQGRTIAALPKMFIRPGQRFALYPTDSSVSIKAWAKCELCQILDETKPLDILSKLTIWTPKALKEILRQQEYLFLTYLRVYQLPQLQEIPVNPNIQEKLGKFVSLPNSLTVSEDKPILSDRTFAQRKHQLEKLEPPLHPELEELQSAIAQLSNTNSNAQQLDNDIKIFLGWNSRKLETLPDSDLVWVQKIAEIGNSSDGHTFEKLVRRGLLKLGFTGSGLNPDATGGAGGMDFYTEHPYPIVGECKATKTEKVTDGTPAQLLKIGMNHLGKFQYENSLKLIVAAGELNFYALRTATENQMNVISPETLQKLVELQAHYKNSINLLELKECLQQSPFGLAEDKVNSYIDKVEQSIKLRSQITIAVKELSEQDNENPKATHQNFTVTEIRVHYNATHNPKLTDEIVHDLLIELSSPLTGYLGRIKGSDWKSDRFYFLRDLSTNLE
ncbi:DUF1802 family protein [Desmonostoc muscorum LEGE 12446]|uniref:DUF1802 family protein n=1 Tax=Desmonostoc muscorum LEGE 12446 TaxID=1828758 RepID=A0A8J7AB37_DESMC|nr:DUF1802 family protein [Desmonostoc muscorum]MCF2148817.1 DUF1802 family protein [Desmonostoc muscorum LEGE 12446]